MAVVDIEKLQTEIVERLKPLDPDKIILFGSYAYGTPSKDSDIDLFLVKDGLTADTTREYELEALKSLRDIRRNYRTNGIDILSASSDFIYNRDDYFYKVEILQNGKVWYERTSS